MCRSGTTELTGAIFILLTPSRLSAPSTGRGKTQTKEILSAEVLVSANEVARRPTAYAQRDREKP